MATSSSWQYLLTPFLSLSLLALPGSSAISGTKSNGLPYIYPLYLKFEEALVRNRSSLYELRDVFFSPIGPNIREVQQFKIHVCITAIVQHNSTAPSISKGMKDVNKMDKYDYGCQRYQWSDSFLSTILSVDTLAILGPVCTSLVYNSMVGSYIHSSTWIHLNLSSLDSLPSDDSISSASMLLMTWAKSFAKAQGRPTVWDDRDRGYVTQRYDYFTSEGINHEQRKYAHYFRIIFTIAFIALNLAIPFILAMLRKILHVLEPLTSPTNQNICCTVITTAVIHNMIYIVLYWTAYFSRWKFNFIACILGNSSKYCLPLDSQHYKDQVMALKVKGIVTLLVLGTELLLAALYSKNNVLVVPCSLLRSVNNVSALIHFLRRVLDTLAIWSVMVAVQIVIGSSLIPIGILLIVGPLFTISIIGSLLTLLVALVICIHLITSSFFGTHSLKLKCKTFLVRTAGCFLFTTLLVVATILYNIIIIMGSNDRGFRGAFLSFLPSILFSFLCWLVRKKLFKMGYSMLSVNSMETHHDHRELGNDCESPQFIPFHRRDDHDEDTSDHSEIISL